MERSVCPRDGCSAPRKAPEGFLPSEATRELPALFPLLSRQPDKASLSDRNADRTPTLPLPLVLPPTAIWTAGPCLKCLLVIPSLWYHPQSPPGDRRILSMRLFIQSSGQVPTHRWAKVPSCHHEAAKHYQARFSPPVPLKGTSSLCRHQDWRIQGPP